jgi:hypothetical protein
MGVDPGLFLRLLFLQHELAGELFVELFLGKNGSGLLYSLRLGAIIRVAHAEEDVDRAILATACGF